MTTIQEIRKLIEEIVDLYGKENANIIIFPYGETGKLVKDILKDFFNIEPKYCIDNKLCKYNDKIKPITFLKDINTAEYRLFLATTNLNVYDELKKDVLRYVREENIVEISYAIKQKQIGWLKQQYIELKKRNQEIKKRNQEIKKKVEVIKKPKTFVGKYSYGPLTNHAFVERVGAFCSIAIGCDVVDNHPTQYISTHPFIYYGSENTPALEVKYNECSGKEWYFDGVVPKRGVDKVQRITIGNDVWLGKNVIITNSANIGNGVIAGAGAVITKDVPDYAVVAGVPARIVRYRYSQEQIEKLNKIAWWDWTDEEIRERYDDFYLNVDEFISKYYVS